MNNNNERNMIPSWLQQFAVKCERKEIVYGDLAVTYNRCSTIKQDSVEWQGKITAGFTKQNNWKLVKAFGAKESATTDDREEFQEMLKFCKKNNISHIVFYSYDRFTRTGNTALIDELRKDGIKVHAATQAVDDETASGRLMQKLYLLFAEMENEQRRQKIIDGQINKLRKGEWIGKPVIGYIKDFVTGKKQHDHDKPQCFIGPRGNLIKQAFMWKFDENLTHEAIVQRLIPMGLTLSPPHLTKIFRNPFYCGYITHSLLDEGEIIRGKHEPLITEKVFLAVNGILSGNKQGYKNVSHFNKMPFKATVKCGKCERPLTAYLQKGIYIYYKCPNKGCCLNISEKKLLDLFERTLSGYTIDPGLLPVIKSRMVATYEMLHQSETARVKPMKDELTRLKNELEKMEFNLATGVIKPELFEKVSASHEQKIRTIEDALKIVGKDTSNFEKLLDSSLEMAINLLKFWQLSEFEAKVRLQKLVFPEGLVYEPEKHALRTISVNPIFHEIASFSSTLNDHKWSEAGFTSEKLPQLYLGFSSSNFLWQSLEEIQSQFIGFEVYPETVENSFSGQTGSGTEIFRDMGFAQRGVIGTVPGIYPGEISGGTSLRIVNPRKFK